MHVQMSYKRMSFMAIFLILTIVSCRTASQNNILKSMQIRIGQIDQFKIENVYGENSEKIVAKRGSEVLRIEKISLLNVVNRTKFINDRKNMIESLYKSIPATYPGEITKEVECQREFWPEYHRKSPELEYYFLTATPRLTYGACSRDLIAYKALLVFLVCKDYMYQIEYFVPVEEAKNDWKEFVNRVACK
jgi:hypothetical protein